MGVFDYKKMDIISWLQGVNVITSKLSWKLPMQLDGKTIYFY